MKLSQIIAKYPNMREHTTGGGCMAYHHPLDNGGCILITQDEANDLPTDEDTSVLLGIYSVIGEERVDTVAIESLEAAIDNALSGNTWVLPDNTIPRSFDECSEFDSWSLFVAKLWEQADPEIRADYETPENHAQCCLFSANGVFVIDARADGKILVTNVG